MKQVSPPMQLNHLHRYSGCLKRMSAASAVALAFVIGVANGAPSEKLSDSVLRGIQALQQEKANRTPEMLKMDSHLVQAVRTNRHENIGVEMHPFVKLHADGRAIVDIDAIVNPLLLDGIANNGGTVDFSSARFHSIRARIPLSKLEKIADLKGVKFIKRAAESFTRTGSIDSEGDVTHKANLARSTFGADGTGVKVGVLSDSVDFLTQAQSTGDLPANVTVLPGQAGIGAGEGTAMMEIIYDLAPGANLYFATGFNSEASFAQNIINLRAAGCDVIVDDIGYFDESPFQDGIVAQAVNQVTADGAIYFSAAGNEGNKDHNNSGTWEGDFVDGGAAGSPVSGKGGNVHSFGATTYDIVDQPGFATVLFWSDPAGASTNDYDLYVVDSTGSTIVNSSTTVQNGNQDPYEIAQPTAPGQRLVVVKASGDARFLHIDTLRGNLRINTAGNVTGHACSTAAFGVAAVDQHHSYPNAFVGGATDPVETFSSDGPRRKFYLSDGTPITPGNYSSTGGTVLQKPDIAAADGVSTTVPGFLPFYGTSAAAPHAAAICALLKSYNSNLDTNQIRTVLTNSALDNEAIGMDRDSGAGIVMALEALTAAPLPVPTPNLAVITNILSGGNGNGVIDPDECNNLDIVITNRGNGTATNISAVLSTTTPGVIIASKTITFPDLVPGAGSIGRTSFKVSTTAEFACGTPIDFTLIINSAQQNRTNVFRLASGTIGAPVSFTNSSPVTIPDANILGVDIPINVSNITGNIAKVTVSMYLTHTFDSDLDIELVGPDNTRVVLSQFNGGSGDNYGGNCSPVANECTFDDSATKSISAANPPFIGSFAPQQSLSAFMLKNGTNLNGTWKLHIADEAQLDVGTLQCWTLNVYPAICTDGGGECPGSDLSVTINDTPDPVLVTSNLTYTMVVSNAGPSSAKSVVLNQSLPGSVQVFSTSSSQGTVTVAPGTITGNLGTIPVYGTATVSVVVIPLTNAIISSTATVGSPAYDSDPSNNSAVAITRVEKPTADVALTMTGTPNPALNGGSITYTVTVTNNGPFTATGVVVTNILPASSIFLSASTTQGTFTSVGNSVLALLGNVTTGMTATVTLNVAPTTTCIVTASAQVAQDPFMTDPVPGNNRATVTTTVSPAADVAVSATATPQQAVFGGTVTNTIVVTNRGPDVADGVTMNAVLPSGSTLISSSTTRGTITTQTGSVSCSMGTMARGDSGTVTVVIAAPRSKTTMVTAVNVSSSQADPNLLNNSVTLHVPVAGPFVNIVGAGTVMTSESFSPRNGIIDIGETVTLQFALQNIGNTAAPSVTASLASTGGVSSPSGTQSFGTLDTGATASAPFTFTATGANGGVVTATLQIQTNGIDWGTATFAFPLPTTTVFSNSIPIAIVDASAANPYPSTIAVSGITGFVSRVTVNLAKLSHTYPDDIGSVVIHPTGRSSILMAHAGGGLKATNVNLTFDNTASIAVPDDSQLTSTRYAPAAYGDAYVFPTNALLPAGAYQANLAAFEGVDPNGNWQLFVADDSAGDSGSIAGGWSVAVTTGTPVNPLAELSVNTALEASSQPPVLLGDTVTFQVVVKNNGPFDATGVEITNVLSAGLSLVSVTAPPYASSSTNGQTIVFSLPGLPFGSNAVFRVTAHTTAAGTLTDTVNIGANEIDLNVLNNTATQVVNVALPSADLGLSASSSASTLTIGNNLVYTLAITNAGPNVALNATVTETLPAGFNYVGSSTSQGSTGISGNVVTISLGNMAPHSVATAFITNAPTIAGTFTTTLVVGTDSSDVNVVNNSVAIATVVVQPAPMIVATGIKLISENLSQNGAVDANEAVTVRVTFSNIGTAPATNLLSQMITNGGVLPLYGGFVDLGFVAPGATVTGEYSFIGGTPPGGTNIMTIDLADTGNGTGFFFPAAVFNFIVPSSPTFSNGSTITIPSFGPASPYPSTITISNSAGVVSKAVLKLSKVSHAFPHDINVLLVSPSGQSVVAMAHCGGAHSITNVDITFDDSASAFLSDSSQITTGSYKPSAFTPAPTFPGISSTPTGTNMAALNGSTANGDWSLYVLDDSASDAGSIGGWSLTLEVANTVNPAAALSLTMTGTPASLLTGNLVKYVVKVVNAGPSVATNVVIADTLPTGVSLVSASIASGTTDVNGSALNLRLPTLASGASASGFITVQAVNAGTLTNAATVSADVADLFTSDNTASVTNTVSQAASAQLAGSYVTGSGYNLVLTGQTGEPYIVQFSTDLVSWVSISTNTPVNGTFTIADHAATNSPTRYYRAFRAPR